MTGSGGEPLVAVYADLGPVARKAVRADDGFVDGADVDGGTVDTADVVGLVVRSESRVDRPFIARFPRLSFVIRAGSGTENLDLVELRRRGVRLVRNPVVSAESVAELALAGLVSLARRVPIAAALLQRGEWRKSDFVGEPLPDLAVTIWGAGPVGRAVARRLTPECRSVHFAQWPSLPSDAPAIAVEPALAASDAHILCLPSRPSTRGWFGPRRLDRVRDARPYLLNLGRFDVVDVAAAVRRLADDQLRGLFIDPVDAHHLPELRAATAVADRDLNLLATPHLGAQRRDVLTRLGEWALDTARLLVKETRDDQAPHRSPAAHLEATAADWRDDARS
ncbi:NAD(P)-dependent oxidoreductase [Plantactinospora sp. B6F1]|uniref:NAD(P)-dependent oxidoreductase n=1 Tax=Plantactinospora sp. B6F1 TaxID=3158971 RepID=UPI0032D8FB67